MMKVGTYTLFQNLTAPPEEDPAVYRGELRLAAMAEPLGFDSVWGVEHHFSAYSMSPNVLQFLAYMAGCTERVEIGSMVIVLPWHDPVRVAGEVTMLDNLSGGRFVLGIGRGLGRLEFEGFRVPMEESRSRFIESARVLLDGLETGRIDFEGVSREIRPRPVRGFEGRRYAASVSPESARIMAELGLGVLIIPQKPWELVARDLETYRTTYAEVHGTQPVPPIVSSQVFCDPDPDRARDLGRRYMTTYFRSVLAHYEMSGAHFSDIGGYEFYAQMADSIGERGQDATLDFYVDLQVWGTPDECFDKIMDIRQRTGCDQFVAVFSYGGIPFDEAERNMKLFAETVAPRLQALERSESVPSPR